MGLKVKGYWAGLQKQFCSVVSNNLQLMFCLPTLKQETGSHELMHSGFKIIKKTDWESEEDWNFKIQIKEPQILRSKLCTCWSSLDSGFGKDLVFIFLFLPLCQFSKWELNSVQLNVTFALWWHIVYTGGKKSMKLFTVPQIPCNKFNSS